MRDAGLDKHVEFLDGHSGNPEQLTGGQRSDLDILSHILEVKHMAYRRGSCKRYLNTSKFRMSFLLIFEYAYSSSATSESSHWWAHVWRLRPRVTLDPLGAGGCYGTRNRAVCTRCVLFQKLAGGSHVLEQYAPSRPWAYHVDENGKVGVVDPIYVPDRLHFFGYSNSSHREICSKGGN